jgi:hypothetical protein
MSGGLVQVDVYGVQSRMLYDTLNMYINGRTCEHVSNTRFETSNLLANAHGESLIPYAHHIQTISLNSVWIWRSKHSKRYRESLLYTNNKILAFANQVPVTIFLLHPHACTHTHACTNTHTQCYLDSHYVHVHAHYCLILIDPPESCEYTQ